MAWVESHEDIADHKKTGFLSQHLECSVPTAVGYVHLLWHYTLKVAWKDGDLSDFIPPMIERACWWEGACGALVKAFQESGYMDGMKVHEWKEYAKHIIYQREYNKKRKQESTPFQQSHNRNKATVTTAATLPDLTRPNHREKAHSKFVIPTQEEINLWALEHLMAPFEAKKFFDHYESNGWRVGKNPMKNWRAAASLWKRRSDEFAMESKASVNPMLPKFKENIPAPEDIFDPTEVPSPRVQK